jgi:hypothetical protein
MKVYTDTSARKKVCVHVELTKEEIAEGELMIILQEPEGHVANAWVKFPGYWFKKLGIKR